MIKIQDLPTDTVAQWVEHRRDKPWSCVQILASDIFFICSVALFFLSASLAKRWKVHFRQTFTKNSTMLIQITTYKYEKLRF